jgi:recombination protein RecA
MKKNNEKNISTTLEKIKKEFGEDSIMMLDQKQNIDVDVIPTGSIGLDRALGVGGLPRGRIIEIYGQESSGKTTLALHIIAEAQKLGGSCAFIDAEHALDPKYAKNIGVKTSELIICQPNGGEEALNIVKSMVEDGTLSVIVVDSVAALTPKNEIDGNIGDVQMATQARMMSQAMRMLTGMISKTNTLVIFINQIRIDLRGYGNPNTTAGGKALRFYSSVRLEIKKLATIKKGDEMIGSQASVKVVKNKVSSPFKTAEFQIIYNEGISKAGEILTLGEKLGLVNKAGAHYKYGEEKIGFGYDAARKHLKENSKVADKIAKDISKVQDEEI